MYLYNLTIKIEKDMIEEWLPWMSNSFIPQVLSTIDFDAHKFCRLISHPDLDGETFALQLFTNKQEVLNDFHENHESKLQTILFQKFGNRLVFFPTVMEIISE
ncbi:MAG: DUF4286 family protein [Bacteroidota bacterium]